MVAPVRFPGGVTNTAPFQALGAMGQPNPAFYHTVFDDFDDFVTGKWASAANVAAGTGNVAPTVVAANGGVLQFTTANTVGANYALTKPVASFQLTATTDAGNGPKTFFYASINAGVIANATAILGLVNTGTNPLATAPTDGIWFSLAAGVLSLNYAIGSVVTTVVIPAASYALANSTFVDLAFSVTPQGSILGWVGANQIGFIPQSGSGANTPAAPYPSARIAPGVALTAVLLNPTVSIGAGTAANLVAQVDYILAAQER